MGAALEGDSEFFAKGASRGAWRTSGQRRPRRSGHDPGPGRVCQAAGPNRQEEKGHDPGRRLQASTCEAVTFLECGYPWLPASMGPARPVVKQGPLRYHSASQLRDIPRRTPRRDFAPCTKTRSLVSFSGLLRLSASKSRCLSAGS